MPGREWTLDGAREMLPEVRERTGRAVAAVERASADAESADADRRAVAREEIDTVASRWVREMEALGVEVKGPWLVDFDNGNGYFCWKWPEESLDYFHGYREGFGARTRIQ